MSIALQKVVDGEWEKVRGIIRDDMELIEIVINGIQAKGTNVVVGRPDKIQSGMAWIDISGTSPNRHYALKYMDGNLEVTIAEVVG